MNTITLRCLSSLLLLSQSIAEHDSKAPSTKTNFLSTLILSALIAGILTTGASSQTINCAPEESCDVWQTRSVAFNIGYYYPSCAGCYATVEWRFRESCSEESGCELFIDKLIIPSGGSCNSCAIGLIIRAGILQAILTSPPCRVDPPGCKTNIQVWMNSCQEKKHLGSQYEITGGDCYNTHCCSSKYVVCWFGGNLTISQSSSTALPAQPCGPIDLDAYFPFDPISGCFMICNYFPQGDITIVNN